MSVTNFLRETIIRLDRRDLTPDERRRTQTVFYDALRPVEAASLELPLPTDPRVRQIALALLANPADARTLPEWGREVGASVRTLTRLFTGETSMTFAQWRLQARIGAAIAGLSQGRSVAEIARSVGYGTTSSFAYAFRRTTGHTPTGLAPISVDADGHAPQPGSGDPTPRTSGRQPRPQQQARPL